MLTRVEHELDNCGRPRDNEGCTDAGGSRCLVGTFDDVVSGRRTRPERPSREGIREEDADASFMPDFEKMKKDAQGK